MSTSQSSRLWRFRRRDLEDASEGGFVENDDARLILSIAYTHERKFDQAMAKLSLSETSYIVIVTRGHRDDMRVLRWAVQTLAHYIGMIGSKRKTITIFRELVKEGLSETLFERVHAPVGFDIGAITPEEIAVAITAELIAARRRVDRPLPHMSWFHSRQLEAKEPVMEASDKET